MLKSTILKINAMESQSRALEERNEIEELKLQFGKEKLQFEKDSKNRADISLKEYEDLKKENQELKDTVFGLERFKRKVLAPFVENNVSPNVINDFLDNKFEIEFVMITNPLKCQQEYTLKFVVKDFEL